MPSSAFKRYGAHRDLHSFPPRRSSDLPRTRSEIAARPRAHPAAPLAPRTRPGVRSEEHTSELQSQFHLVCRLLLLNDTAPTEIYTLSLHDALPICPEPGVKSRRVLALTRRLPSLLERDQALDRKSTRLNSSHSSISYAVFCF